MRGIQIISAASLLLVVPLALTACYSPRGGGGGGGGGGGDDDDDVVECGWNAEPTPSGDCSCVDDYEWCDWDTDGIDCCAYSTNSFRLVIGEAKVIPYKNAENREPWDWDGNVPDWLLQAVDLLSDFYPDAAAWSEVLQLVDEYAPELLEGTVPPDPFVEVYIEDEFLGATSTDDDTIEPYWNQEAQVTLGSSELVWLVFQDEDLQLDDLIQEVSMDLLFLQETAGRGWQDYTDLGNVFELTVAAEPE